MSGEESAAVEGAPSAAEPESPAPPDPAEAESPAPESPASPAAAELDGTPEPEREPDDFYGWAMRSYARMREGDPDAAWEAAQKAMEHGTAEPDLYVPLCQQFTPERRRLLAHSAMERTHPSHDAFQWLWVEVALGFWYEGQHDEAVAEFETILQQKNLDPQLQAVMENSLGMCLEAVDRYPEAEERYLSAGNEEAAVRARARSGDVLGAVEMIRRGIGPSDETIRAALEATYLGLLGRPILNLPERLARLLAMEEDWIYKEFMVGVLLVIGERQAEGIEQLERFLEICRINSNEWGVTLRWEIGIAQEILRILAGGEPAAAEAEEEAPPSEAEAPEAAE